MNVLHWPGHKWNAYKQTSKNYNSNDGEIDRIRELHIHEHQRLNAATKVTNMLKQYKDNHGLMEDEKGINVTSDLEVTEYKNHPINDGETPFKSEEEVETKEATSASSAGGFVGPLK
tara:strand:+ start:357 stop:707 length:351 start_codon:yes stop_codon:yes gene_type:complete